jgi:hypothetical protein
MMNQSHFAWTLFLLLMGLNSKVVNPSTSEQRAKWVEITRKLETAPLEKNSNLQAEAVIKEIEEAHDIHVGLCPTLLSDLNGLQYQYAHIMTRQFMLASTAFMVEYPTKADSNRDDRRAKNLAAIISVLKTYGSILQMNPDSKSKFLDDLIQRQTQGKLSDYVKNKCP